MATFNINDVARRVQYTSTGQTAFNFSFQVNASSELQVYVNDVVKAETTHYSVSLNGDGTGTVTFNSATTAGEIITIIGDQPLSRTTVFQTGQTNNPTTLETEFDNVLIRQQQLKEITDRSIQLKPSTTRTVTGSGTSGPVFFPYGTTTENSGKIIRYNSAGTSLELGPDTTSIDTLAALSTELTTLSGISSAISGVHSNASNINNLNSNISAVTNVNSNLSAITTTNSNISTIANVNSNLTPITNVNNALTNINQVASNLSAVSDFANIYLGASSSAPTQDPDGSSLDDGDLYFDTSTNTLRVYASGSGWQSAGSSINGTSARFTFTVSSSTTTITGNDNYGNTLAYDAGFVDVYLNGVRMVNGTDVTVTSGTSIVFANPIGASGADTVDIIAFGTFQVANIAASAITSGTLGAARGGTGKTTSDLSGNAGKALVVNTAQNGFDLANTSSAEVYGFNLGFAATTVNYTVTVQSVGGSNKYFILGTQQKTLELMEGNTYVFSYPSAHPFALSTTSDGTHGGGSEYTTGVTRDSSANTLTYVVPTGAPQLYYYCTNHSGMGGTANTPAAVNNTLQVTTTNAGADNIDAATYAAFDDVIFASTGFTFSVSDGNLIATI